jgi:putative oxidoreductase
MSGRAVVHTPAEGGLVVAACAPWNQPMHPTIRTLVFGGGGAATIFGDLGLALARISIGGMMAIGHGYSKIWHDGGFGPPQQLVQGIASMGLPMPTLAAWLSAFAEFAAAILLALGLLTRAAALVLIVNMAVAAFVAHGGDPLFMSGGRAKEPALLYLIPFVLFFFTGAGRFSIDALIAPRRLSRAAAT